MTELQQRFEQLAGEWEAHCAAHAESSNPFVYVQHPSFEALVGLGEAALPLIISRYRHGSVFWGAALRRITGNTGFGDGVTGNLEATRGRWLAWWDAEHGLGARSP